MTPVGAAWMVKGALVECLAGMSSLGVGAPKFEHPEDAL